MLGWLERSMWIHVFWIDLFLRHEDLKKIPLLSLPQLNLSRGTLTSVLDWRSIFTSTSTFYWIYLSIENSLLERQYRCILILMKEFKRCVLSSFLSDSLLRKARRVPGVLAAKRTKRCHGNSLKWIDFLSKSILLIYSHSDSLKCWKIRHLIE